MSDTVISVENLSKRYLIGHETAQRGGYKALRDIIAREARNFVRKAADLIHGKQIIQGDEVEELWALRNVSFEVKRGEVLGIIGRNGAGKSTLLKILSRITEPTEGRARLRGRVGSLLEVGTGFHSELTGRENMFLNGAILGMSRVEIKRKFDEIVAFAEIGKFLDTPVKRYSSGMYIRLAFAVAAHLEPEILIVDEVLSVGDVEFQKKCLGKMGEVAREGRTVLFVSHNLNAISRLCNRAILVDAGKIHSAGPAVDVVRQYLSLNAPDQETEFKNTEHATNDAAKIVGARRHGPPVVTNGTTFEISFSVHFLQSVQANFILKVHREFMLCFVATDMHAPVLKAPAKPGQTVEIMWRIPAYLLNPGSHRFGIGVTSPEGIVYFAHVDHLLPTEIHDDGVRRGVHFNVDWGGAVSPLLDVFAMPSR